MPPSLSSHCQICHLRLLKPTSQPHLSGSVNPATKTAGTVAVTTGLFLVRLTGSNLSFSFNARSQKRPHHCTLTAPTLKREQTPELGQDAFLLHQYPHRVPSLSMTPESQEGQRRGPRDGAALSLPRPTGRPTGCPPPFSSTLKQTHIALRQLSNSSPQ